MDTTQLHGKIKLGNSTPVEDLKVINKPHPIWQGARTCKDQDGKLCIICNFPGCLLLFKHPSSTTVLHDHYASLKTHAEKLKVYDSEAQALQKTTDFPKAKRMKKQVSQPQLQFQYIPLSDRVKDLRAFVTFRLILKSGGRDWMTAASAPALELVIICCALVVRLSRAALLTCVNRVRV